METVYETLLGIWNKERASEELTSIPEKLLEDLAEYFSYLRRQIRLSDRSSLNTRVRSAELEMLQRLLESLLRIRMRKIVAMAFQQPSVENVLPFEKKTFNVIQRVMSQHEDMIRSGLNDPRMLQREIERRYEVVIFLKDFPRFVGEDLSSYGPFKAGDVAAIYSGNVPALARKNVVKPVKLI
ncbi:MAG: hypothetical protein QXH12_01370 [Candidatus Caldarchaeum sp.]|uniref:DNA replication complex GINS family protein n=1 Tax=Caldiarchaeum subterraneum TaxID=311458 RepID=A0A7C5LCW1_CALS0